MSLVRYMLYATQFSQLPLQIYMSATKMGCVMSDLITPHSSLPPHCTLPSHLQLRQGRTWLRVWRWSGVWCVCERESVMEEIPSLIFTCLLNWTLLKDGLCSRTTSCLRDWRPSSLTHNQQPESAGVGILIKPGGGLLLHYGSRLQLW